MSVNMENLGKHIKLLRKGKKLTQKELARVSGISERQLITIEKGGSDLRVSTMYKLSIALGIPLEELFPLQSSI